MSTRAVYTFKDKNDIFHVYKHSDGYPRGAAEWIAKALKLSWDLPRFEASEFASAFVAANKRKGGGVYLTETYKAHGDLDYRYEISFNGSYLIIHAFNAHNEECIFEGTLDAFIVWVETI